MGRFDISVTDVPLLVATDCPSCGESCSRIRKEDHSSLLLQGAAVTDEVARYFVEPCGHRIQIVVEDFGRKYTIEKFPD